MSSSGTGSSDAIMQDTVILICPCCQLEVQCRNAPRARERPLLTHIMDVHCQNGDLICPVPKCGQPQKDLHLLREHLRNEVRKRNRHIHTPCPLGCGAKTTRPGYDTERHILDHCPKRHNPEVMANSIYQLALERRRSRDQRRSLGSSSD